MAKKPSSKSKKRSVDQSAAKGGGIMSLNKSNTSPFMKTVIVIIIIAMVTLFLYGGVTGIIALFQKQPQQAAVSALTTLSQQYDPQIQSYNAMLASSPSSYTVLVNLGNTHMNYAQDLQKLPSTTGTATMALFGQEVAASRDAYKKAVTVNKNADPGVYIDYSISTFYSGDTTGAIAIAKSVIAKNPNFAPAHFNLGIYYEAANQNALAAAEFQKYLALDPNGTAGNPTYAKQQLSKLGGASSIPTTGSTTTTP